MGVKSIFQWFKHWNISNAASLVHAACILLRHPALLAHGHRTRSTPFFGDCLCLARKSCEVLCWRYDEKPLPDCVQSECCSRTLWREDHNQRISIRLSADLLYIACEMRSPLMLFVDTKKKRTPMNILVKYSKNTNYAGISLGLLSTGRHKLSLILPFLTELIDWWRPIQHVLPQLFKPSNLIRWGVARWGDIWNMTKKSPEGFLGC
jgi:hypothetical protein